MCIRDSYMSAHCPLMLAKEAAEASEAEDTAAVGLRILEAAVP